MANFQDLQTRIASIKKQMAGLPPGNHQYIDLSNQLKTLTVQLQNSPASNSQGGYLQANKFGLGDAIGAITNPVTLGPGAAIDQLTGAGNTGHGPGTYGTYNEGYAIDATNQLKALRAKLDNGDISVADYLKQAQPVAQTAISAIQYSAAQGSKAANIVNPLVAQIKQAGFYQQPTGELTHDFGEQYEAQLRKALAPAPPEALPPSAPPDEQKQFQQDQKISQDTQHNISQIPADIPIASDQGQIEKEAARENAQSSATLQTQDTSRKQSLADLAALLSNTAYNNFQRSIPQIAEDSNTSGIYRSTGFGNALALKQSQLQQDVMSQLGQQGITNENLYTSGLGDILSSQENLQQQALNRKFGLYDMQNNKNATIQIGQALQPQSQGKTGLQKAAGGAQAAGQLGTATAALAGK